jgi:hypothetical protein
MNEKKDIVGFFHEEKNVRSMMRLLSFISVLAAVLSGGMTIALKAGTVGLWVTALFLVGAFVPKAFQKVVENRYFLKVMGLDEKTTEEQPQQNEAA